MNARQAVHPPKRDVHEGEPPLVGLRRGVASTLAIAGIVRCVGVSVPGELFEDLLGRIRSLAAVSI
jgi:hypothetical protein